MRMHKSFQRSKPVAAPIPVLGGDGVAGTPPTGLPNPNEDNVLVCAISNAAGWPSHRVAVSYKGPVGATALAAQIWIFDHETAAWYEVGAPVNIVANRINYFDIIGLADPPAVGNNVGPNARPSSGGTEIMLIVQDDLVGPAPNGTYTFAMGPDLTVLPG